MKNTIVTGSLIVFSDGFVWKRLSNEKAYKIWVSAENVNRSQLLKGIKFELK